MRLKKVVIITNRVYFTLRAVVPLLILFSLKLIFVRG